jgi:hypothetical protein
MTGRRMSHTHTLRTLAWRIECRALENAVEAHPDPARVSWCADSEVLQEAVQCCACGSGGTLIETRNGCVQAVKLVDFLGLWPFVQRRTLAALN